MNDTEPSGGGGATGGGAGGSDVWDFYPCRVDDAAATISLNLRYQDGGHPPAADTRYRLTIEMVEPDEHGMGSPTEADALYPVQDRLVGAAAELGLIYLARLRHRGIWQLTFYGPAGHDAALARIAGETDARGRSVTADAEADPDWSYYRESLVPDAERRQWMSDRRLVEALVKDGDVTSTARRIDHWLYFSSPGARTAFVAEARRAGFALVAVHDDPNKQRRFGVQLQRADAVELEHIHAVVMSLRAMAAELRGDYDIWETSVERSRS